MVLVDIYMDIDFAVFVGEQLSEKLIDLLQIFVNHEQEGDGWFVVRGYYTASLPYSIFSKASFSLLSEVYPVQWTQFKGNSWKWYNKVDTKLREFSERGLLYGKKKL